jgi:hemin uptake protein HemP
VQGLAAESAGLSMSEPQEPAEVTESPPSESQLVVEAQNLFQGRREIYIDHAGVRYRLRITRRNKLILQK